MSQLRSAKFVLSLACLVLPAGGALADQIDYTLDLVVHDYGKLVASSRACKLNLDEMRLRETVLDVVSTDSNLDEDETSEALNNSVEKRVLRKAGCSNASVTIAQDHFNRDLTDLRYAISVDH